MKALVNLSSPSSSTSSVADPGFPMGGGGMSPLGEGRGPLTWVLFGKNVCEKELGPIGGACGAHAF